MDPTALLDELLQSGRALAKESQALAEKKLQIPESGPDRDAMLSGLGKGAALGGLLAVLLGTRTGRRVTGSAVKLGGLAAIGGLAYKTLRDWQARHAAETESAGTPIDQLAGPQSEQRSLALLKAMIGAAKADGHIDAQEQTQIDRQLQKLAPDAGTHDFLHQELAKPLRTEEIAANADTPETAIEMYLVSLAVIDGTNPQERAYLSDLARDLKLAPSLIETLELHVRGSGEAGARG